MSKNLFGDFLSYFPQVELPVSITLDSHRTFDQVNDLLPFDLATQFIIQEDELAEEEFTEFLPCFKLPEFTNREFISLVYWKGALLRHDFILATYTKTGIPISRQVIAGTSSDGKNLYQKVAAINTDGDVDVILSHQIVDQRTFDASNTKEIYYELLPNGYINELNEKEENK